MRKAERSRPHSNQYRRLSSIIVDKRKNTTSKNCKNHTETGTSSSDEKINEWEETRCPICMEHPHNPKLLVCSSHEKGCRPFICDTSHRHSNCFDQFCKSHGLTLSDSNSNGLRNSFLHHGNREDFQGLACPLCRGSISGWIVEHDARRHLNSKIRGCALESCEFSGNYEELRKHARVQHPRARPSEADEERQSLWDQQVQNDNRLDALHLQQSLWNRQEQGDNRVDQFIEWYNDQLRQEQNNNRQDEFTDWYNNQLRQQQNDNRQDEYMDRHYNQQVNSYLPNQSQPIQMNLYVNPHIYRTVQIRSPDVQYNIIFEF